MASAGNLFIQIDGVKGNVTDKQYKDWIAIHHMSTGVHNSASIDNGSGKLNSGGAYFEEISFSKEVDATSTQLFSMVAQGSNIKKIVVAFCVQSGEKFHEMGRWTYEDCILTRDNINVNNSGGIPDEGFSMVFGSVKFETSVIDSKGSTSKQGPVGWDQVKNTKL